MRKVYRFLDAAGKEVDPKKEKGKIASVIEMKLDQKGRVVEETLFNRS